MERDPDSAVSLWAKYTMFFINFIIFLVFGALVVITATAVNEIDPPVASFWEWLADVRCVACFLSCYVLVMSTLGWYGALRENIRCLRLFRLMLLILILIEVLILTWIFLTVYAPEVTKFTYHEDTYRRAIVRYRDPGYQSIKEMMDTFQIEFECCGVSNDDDGYLDWSANEYFNCTGYTDDNVTLDFCAVPYSCCIINSGDMRNLYCGQGMQLPSVAQATRESKIHTRGCFKGFVEYLKNNIQVIGAIAAGVIIPEVAFFNVASILQAGIERQMEKWRFTAC